MTISTRDAGPGSDLWTTGVSSLSPAGPDPCPCRVADPCWVGSGGQPAACRAAPPPVRGRVAVEKKTASPAGVIGNGRRLSAVRVHGASSGCGSGPRNCAIRSPPALGASTAWLAPAGLLASRFLFRESDFVIDFLHGARDVLPDALPVPREAFLGCSLRDQVLVTPGVGIEVQQAPDTPQERPRSLGHRAQCSRRSAGGIRHCGWKSDPRAFRVADLRRVGSGTALVNRRRVEALRRIGSRVGRNPVPLSAGIRRSGGAFLPFRTSIRLGKPLPEVPARQVGLVLDQQAVLDAGPDAPRSGSRCRRPRSGARGSKAVANADPGTRRFARRP